MCNRSRVGLLAAVAVAFFLASPAARALGDGPLRVLRITPSGTDVPSSSQEIVVKFDRDVVPLGNMARKPGEIPIDIKPALDCEWRWLSNDELACRLPGDHHLRPATHYTVHIGTGFAALDGSRLAAPVTADFTTELPKVHWARFERWLSPVTPQFQLMFTLPVTARAAARSVMFVRDGTGESVPARATPFTTERSGPLLLPVPGVPGAVVLVNHPQPVKPTDAGKPAYAARTVWLVQPTRKLAPGARYTLKLEPGLTTPLGDIPGTGGAMPGQTDIATFGPFRLRGIDCRAADGSAIQYRVGAKPPVARCVPDSVRVAFSAPVPLATLAAVRWAPAPVSGAKLVRLWSDYPQWSLRMPDDPEAGKHGSDYGLPFRLSAMQQYRVSVRAGVTDRFGRKLAAPAALDFLTGHLLPTLSPETTGGVLEANEDTAIALRFSNLTRLDLNYHRLTAAALEGTAAEPPEGHTLSLLKQFGGTPPRDRLITVPLGARKLLGGKDGVIAGKLDWAPRTRGSNDAGLDMLAEVTPWEVLAKVGHFGTLVWVNSLATGDPVANARLRFYTAPKKKPWAPSAASAAATTDDDGLAALPGTVALGAQWNHRWSDKSPDWFVGATRGGAMAYLPLTWTYERDVGDASSYAFYGDTRPAYGHLRTWAVTAQGVYRPGATVHYAAFVRGVGNTALKPAPDLRYTLTITDPTGKKIAARKDVKLSAFGGIHGDLYIPKGASTGWYHITLSWPGGGGTQSSDAGRFLVTAFVPASFKVNTLLHGSRFTPGDAVAAQVQARLHAGGPYTAAPIRFTVKLDAAPFAPDTPAAAGFTFDSNAESAPDSLTLYQDTGRLDGAGNAHMHFTLPGKSPIVYGKLVVQSAVESARGTWVANRADAVWSSRDRFIGLKIDEWLLHAEKPFDLHYLVVDTGGKPQAGSRVRISLQRRKIDVVQVADGAGNYRPEQNATWIEEGRCDAVSAAAPGVCRLTPAHSGAYRVVADVTDTHGKTQRTTLRAWAIGSGQVLWPSGKGVTLVPDQASYHVGDTAHVLVQNPYPGARALVTVERYGILWKKVVTLASGTPVLDIPVEKSFFPGAYLSVAIFSPRVAKPDAADLGKPTMALGYVALPVTGKGSSLSVQVKPEHDQYKPRQRVNVDVKVNEAGGKPAAHARLVVAVVDEAVLDLVQGGAAYYDPRKTFYAPRDGPDVSNYSLIGQLVTTLKQTRVGKGRSPGGGGGKGIPVRSVFKYTAFWKPDVQTDASGHAHFSFELPDNLTGWRLLVIALEPGAKMGLGQSTVRVNLPLQIGPALPNIVHAGDEFHAGFSVNNRTQVEQHVSVGISARGAAGGTASSALDLAPYAHALAWLKLQAPAPGEITLEATARAGKLGDAMRKTVPVEAAGTRVVAAAYGSITGKGASIPVELPADAVKGSGALAVSLAPTALANLIGAFAHMRDDPLKTWEVRLSRGVMASDYLALKDALPASFKWPEAARQIADVLKHAADFQAPNGGMAFWVPRNDFVSPYLSVYTALAFNWLEAAGHTPPADARAALDDYLRNNIIKTTGKDASQTGPVLKAAALAALAGHGKLPKGAVAGMLPKLPQLDLFGKAMLLQAALETRDTDSAGKIATAILAHAEETAGSISFQEIEADAYVSMLASPLRSNCAVLDALTLAGQAGGGLAATVADVPAKLLRWIDARRATDGAWPNSQENVFCTTAQAHYTRAFEGPVNNLGGRVASAGHDIGHATFASRRSAPQSIHGKAPTGATTTVDIERSGKGRLYYGVNLAYTLPAAKVPAADAGFSVHREYRIERGGKWARLGPATRLQRGDIVRVDLLVDVPAERHYVVLTDPLPGAFEAVDHKLATADVTTPERTPNGTILWFDYGDWPNYSVVSSGFYHRDTALDAVRFYADVLPAGRYHLIYAAQVVAPGRFLAPPAQVHEIYQPDVFGRGTPATVTVALPLPAAAPPGK